MSDQFKILVFVDRNATINQGVPILDPSKLKVKNNVGQGSFGEVYTAEFLEPGQHSIQVMANQRHPCFRSHLGDLRFKKGYRGKFLVTNLPKRLLSFGITHNYYHDKLII